MDNNENGEVTQENAQVQISPATVSPEQNLVSELAHVKKTVKGLLITTVILSVVLAAFVVVGVGSHLRFDHGPGSRRGDFNRMVHSDRFGSRAHHGFPGGRQNMIPSPPTSTTTPAP